MIKHRVSYSLTLLVLSTLAITGMIQSSAVAEDWKIGVVDMDKVRENHEWLNKEYEKLEGVVKELEAELEPLQKQIDDETQKYNAEKESMSAVDRMTKEAEIREMTVRYENGWRTRQLQIDEKEVEVNKEALQDIRDVINTLAAEEEYHLILRAQDDPRSQVLFFVTKLDITSLVIERLNKLKKD